MGDLRENGVKARRPDVHPPSGAAAGTQPCIGAFGYEPADPDRPHRAEGEGEVRIGWDRIVPNWIWWLSLVRYAPIRMMESCRSIRLLLTIKSMDDSYAAVVGALIGVAATLAGSALTHRLQTKRQTSLAEKRRNRVRRMLSGEKYKWRSITTLAASIGTSEETTAELLIEIDARTSLSNGKLWVLESRAPWPSDLQPDD